jgi:hypothetical protein
MARKLPKPSEDPNFDYEANDEESIRLSAATNEVVEARIIEAGAAQAEKQTRVEQAAKVECIVERGRRLTDEITFNDVKRVRMGDMFIAVPEPTDRNKLTVIEALFAGQEENRPHWDQWSGRIVDHRGEVLDDKYNGVPFLHAFDAIGLRKLKVKEIIDVVRTYALQHKQNDLQIRINKMIPAWDGVERIALSLVDTFGAERNEMNIRLSTYHWLSLFVRAMHPGEEAAIVPCLVGAQHCGKSAYWDLLAKLITGNDDNGAIKLSLDGDKTDFLRSITGVSPLAVIAEGAGISKAELRKTKAFLAASFDQFSYKWEGHINQPRQWVTVMDANSTADLLTDETGNRRIWPMECFGMRKGEVADFEPIKRDIWQMFAECRDYIDTHGLKGYREFLREASKLLNDWSLTEMKAGRYTVRDDVVEPYIVGALASVDFRTLTKKDGSGARFLFCDRDELLKAFRIVGGEYDPTKGNGFFTGLAKLIKLKANGVAAYRNSKTIPGFAFPDYETRGQLLAMLGEGADDDEGEIVIADAKTKVRAAGF